VLIERFDLGGPSEAGRAKNRPASEIGRDDLGRMIVVDASARVRSLVDGGPLGELIPRAMCDNLNRSLFPTWLARPVGAAAARSSGVGDFRPAGGTPSAPAAVPAGALTVGADEGGDHAHMASEGRHDH
jgi:hypothetical protein